MMFFEIQMQQDKCRKRNYYLNSKRKAEIMYLEAKNKKQGTA